MSDTTPADAGANTATPVISVRPVTIAAPSRGQDLQVRVSAPMTGRDLPVVVFSHGMTLTMDDHAPLAGFWAARGRADREHARGGAGRRRSACPEPAAPA